MLNMVSNSELAARWLVNEWIGNGQDLEYCEQQQIFNYWRDILSQRGGIIVTQDHSFQVAQEVRYLLWELRGVGVPDNDHEALAKAWAEICVKIAVADAEEAQESA